MVWQPGQTGNPKGHYSKGKGYSLKAMADNYTASALNVIVSLMEDPAVKPSDRLTAARMVLDRAHGLPTQTVDMNTTLSVSLVELLAGLPGQPRAATIEHDAPPPRLPASFSLLDAAQAAEELAGQAADEEDADTCTLVLCPANDDPGDTQPGGE
jgi:hypothetical protein